MKCDVIIHSAKETGQQEEQWGWGLVVTGKWGEAGKCFEKARVGNIGVFIDREG